MPHPLAPCRIASARWNDRRAWIAITVLAAAASAAGLYGIASATATSLASNFQPLAPTDIRRMHDVATASNRATDEHRAASLQCRTVAKRLRARCNAEAAQDSPLHTP